MLRIKSIIQKVKCKIYGHKWLDTFDYKYKIFYVTRKRQCMRCGLIVYNGVMDFLED